jgi:hypothetical protein
MVSQRDWDKIHEECADLRVHNKLLQVKFAETAAHVCALRDEADEQRVCARKDRAENERLNTEIDRLREEADRNLDAWFLHETIQPDGGTYATAKQLIDERQYMEAEGERLNAQHEQLLGAYDGQRAEGERLQSIQENLEAQVADAEDRWREASAEVEPAATGIARLPASV